MKEVPHAGDSLPLKLNGPQMVRGQERRGKHLSCKGDPSSGDCPTARSAGKQSEAELTLDLLQLTPFWTLLCFLSVDAKLQLFLGPLHPSPSLKRGCHRR